MIHRSLLAVVLLCVVVPLSAQQAGRRDPFVPLVSPPSMKAPVGVVATRRAPGLAGIAAADVELKGIITSATIRIALLAGPDGRTYLARAQDRLHDAVIRRIDTDAVVLLTAATPAGAGREVRKPLRPRGEGGGQ